MDQYETWKEAVRAATKIAGEQRQGATIARALGVPRSNVYTFIARGVMGHDTLQGLRVTKSCAALRFLNDTNDLRMIDF